MPNHITIFLLLILPLIISQNPAEAAKRRIHISDDLDDVVDEEEDESWKQWGKKTRPTSEFDLKPSDLAKMGMSEIQAEMMKRNSGPAFGFVKLQFRELRTRDMVAHIAMKWTKVLRTGAIEVKFMGVDLNTIMFNMERGQDTAELKEFLLNQPEAYEIKIGDEVFRRPGDPPLEDILAQLQNEKNKVDNNSPIENNKHLNEEL